jgi:undecaprenyl pyrophosphate phosphatase UppP
LFFIELLGQLLFALLVFLHKYFEYTDASNHEFVTGHKNQVHHDGEAVNQLADVIVSIICYGELGFLAHDKR